MNRGRPKSTLKVNLAALKAAKPSSELAENGADSGQTMQWSMTAGAKSMKKTKEPVLHIKPTLHAQKQGLKLKGLTQGNFYNKVYREKAC